MKAVLKKYFIPHEENDFHPHLLHTKRAIFYGALFACMKAVLVVFALLLPTEAFLIPDVLSEQAKQIAAFTNSVREQKGLVALKSAQVLTRSASAKAEDMANNNYFSHTGPHKHTLAYFLGQAGYSYRVAGENLAMGFSDAQSVVDAWIKSPSHYSNLIDTDFSEIGVGVEAGYYNGQPTVYVAQHFGDPTKKSVSVEVSTSTVAVSAPGHVVSAPTQVAGEKIVSTSSVAGGGVVYFDRDISRVYWMETANGTKFDVRARIAGPVQSAMVLVQNYPIELRRTGADDMYAGSITVNEPVDTFFNPVITPGITIRGALGDTTQDTIDWFDIKIAGKSPIQKYLQAKQLLSPITNIFSVSRVIYWGFLILFAGALIVNIVVEIRKQHYHIIAQTLLIIAFLGWLLWI